MAAMAAMAPHELLRVWPDASVAGVKAAYKKLVKSYHPDKAHAFMARHNEEVVKLVNGAFTWRNRCRPFNTHRDR